MSRTNPAAQTGKGKRRTVKRVMTLPVRTRSATVTGGYLGPSTGR
jgi:hypothetical protein